MVGRFVGKHGSMGFEYGKIYELRSEVRAHGRKEAYIYLFDIKSNKWCPYETLESLLDNWKFL